MLSPVVFLSLSSCSSQEPAFKDEVSTSNLDSANATRRNQSMEDERTQDPTRTQSGTIDEPETRNTRERSTILVPESEAFSNAGGNRDDASSNGQATANDSGSLEPSPGAPGREGQPDVVAAPREPVSQDDSPFIPAPLPSRPPSPPPGAGNPPPGGNPPGGSEGGVGTEGPVNLSWKVVEFTQKGAGKVDLLWVVDTSGSMSEEQAYLATNFSRMIYALNAAGHDFQTAITTTDVCQEIVPLALDQRVCPANYGGTAATRLQGSFLGTAGRTVLKKSDSDLIEKFNSYTKAGVNGSGFEHGLYAAKLALDKVRSGQNAALVRPDSFLAVIVVSDEEDDGIGLSMVDAYNGHNFVAEGLTTFKFTDDDMISYLQEAKGQGKFSISAIAPTRLSDGSMCSAPHTTPLEEGTQYIKAAQKSGGMIQSLCDTDWSQSLATLGVDLNAQITQINLPSVPEPTTIKVMANGQMTRDWTYNAANNAIKFNLGHVPPAGAQIYVGYYEKP